MNRRIREEMIDVPDVEDGTMASVKKESAPKALGMEENITRRDFLNAALLASGSALMGSISPAELLAQPAADDWTGYGGVGDYANSNGNTRAVLEAGHKIRDGVYDNYLLSPTRTGEVFDCVVVGGGISGLAAALFFLRQAGAGKTCLVLDNHPMFGGEAKRNEFLVDGQRLIAHQGSAFFPVPYPHSFIGRFYESIGMASPRFEYQKWGGTERELPLSRTPYTMNDTEPATYGFYFGAKFGQRPGMWLIDPWGRNLAGAPIPEKDRTELLKWWNGQDAANSPAPDYFGDAISRRLDTMTLEQHLMEKHGLSQETIRAYLSPVEGGGYGLGPDALSAYTQYSADTLHPLDISEETGAQMFPGGNTGFARMITKTLLPEAISGAATVEGVCRGNVNFAALDQAGSATRIRLDSTVVSVHHDGDPKKAETVSVAYTRAGKLYRLNARSVVMAGGSWTTKHIVRDLPATHQEAYAEFYRSPALMANVAVRNWRPLYKMGITGGRWFEGVGNYTEVRKIATFGADSPTIGPDSPTVLALKVLYSYPGLPTEAQGHRGRSEMLSIPFVEYERRIREQFQEMFGAKGFDARKDIAGIILNRWGHAYLSPAPGFFFGKNGHPPPSDVLRAAPFGRITFANADLSGIMDHRTSILEANRAVGQILDQVLKS
jgi:spermidine dehydrogenase